MRLPRARKGKMPVDVVITNQEAGPRVRISVGWDNESKRNSDLTFKDTEDLIVLLQYHLAKARGDLKDD